MLRDYSLSGVSVNGGQDQFDSVIESRTYGRSRRPRKIRSGLFVLPLNRFVDNVFG